MKPPLTNHLFVVFGGLLDRITPMNFATCKAAEVGAEHMMVNGATKATIVKVTDHSFTVVKIYKAKPIMKKKITREVVR